MESMIKKWTQFLDGCLAYRVEVDLFAAAVAQLHAESPIPGQKLAFLLLRPHDAGSIAVDPRVLQYFERLLADKKIDASDVLASTFHFSKDRLPKTSDPQASKNPRCNNPPELEEIVFHRLQAAFGAGKRPGNNVEGIRTLIIVTRWMQALVTSHTSDTMIQAMAGIQHQPPQQSINVREGLAMLVVSIIENPRMLQILNHPKGKGRLHVFFSQNRLALVSQAAVHILEDLA